MTSRLKAPAIVKPPSLPNAEAVDITDNEFEFKRVARLDAIGEIEREIRPAVGEIQPSEVEQWLPNAVDNPIPLRRGCQVLTLFEQWTGEEQHPLQRRFQMTGLSLAAPVTAGTSAGCGRKTWRPSCRGSVDEHSLVS